MIFFSNTPVLLGTYETTDDTVGVTLSNDGTKAYVADGYSDLQIIDITLYTLYKVEW